MINRGSEWNIWDLHVHTPASGFGEEEDYPKLIENLKKSEADIIGINDYCTIQGYKKILELGGVTGKILFPVVEFRMNNKINHKNSTAIAGGVSINFHLIFDNNLPVNQIETELNSLECFSDRGITKRLGHIESVDDLKKISFDFFKTIETLENSILKNSFIVWVPYDEYGGIDPIDPEVDGFLKMGIINKAHILGSGNTKQISFFRSKRCLEDIGKNIACIKGSDSHQIEYPFGRLRDENSRPIDRYCWIKGEKTFKALKHLIVEPIDRVFIGENNSVQERIKLNRTKYIDSLKINQIEGYVGTDGVWFKDIEVPLNSELVAIIGNKGNGKSALADIIALCGNYKGSHNDFSFLNKNKFNENSGKIAKNFEATLKWKSGNEEVKFLNERIDDTATEKVKYLPQGYFERLTNNHTSIEEFNKEIENVVFTHLNDDDKLGYNSFQELIDYKTQISEEEIQKIKNKLSLLNKEIFAKEKRLNPEYKKSIEEKKRQKEEELKALIEPDVVKNPNDDPDYAEKNEKTTKNLQELNKKLDEQTNLLEEKSEEKSILLIEINELKDIKKRMENKQSDFNSFIEEIDSVLSKYDLSGKSMFKISYDLEKLDSKIKEKNTFYNKIKILLGEEKSTDEEFKSIPIKLEEIKNQILEIQKSLGEDEKKYQDYLIQKKAWEQSKAKVIGNKETPGTLEYYKCEIEYIDTKLSDEILKKKEERFKLSREVFDLKNTVLDIYKEIKTKIDTIIDENQELLEAYPININATLSFKSNFESKFLGFISLNRLGTFYGSDNAIKQFKKLTKEFDANDFEEIELMLNGLIDALFYDVKEKEKEESIFSNIENQVKEVVDLYDYLFSLEFLEINYQLRQEEKDLFQLSPGEKGALLLTFYLLLDNNDIPLIIDQPEDNLDNHSVANILVPFIRKAKSYRQIIIVTHNPNLAVVADAEQIIYTELDKGNNNKFEVKSGAIENPVINDCIVKVLEGAMPAFNKRKLKYYEM